MTSPTHGCGKSIVAANLALSLARRPSGKTVLLDMELRAPQLAYWFGMPDAGALRDFLDGKKSLQDHFRRIGETLVLGLNNQAESKAAEILQEPSTAQALSTMMTTLKPEIVVMDAPPALVSDDVVALAHLVDAVLLIADGTRSSPRDIRACEKLFDNNLPVLGVVLNRAQDRSLSRYRYARKR
ncbi:MAG: P-loop NTPase [Pseudorhodobacter sp.]